MCALYYVRRRILFNLVADVAACWYFACGCCCFPRVVFSGYWLFGIIYTEQFWKYMCHGFVMFQDIRESDVKILTLGIGSNVNSSFLLGISGDVNNVFHVKSFSDLSSIETITSFIVTLCDCEFFGYLTFFHTFPR